MDDKLVNQVTQVVRKADEEFEVAGGTSRHWVRDHFLPHLEIAGLVIIPKAPEGSDEPVPDGRVSIHEGGNWVPPVNYEYRQKIRQIITRTIEDQTNHYAQQSVLFKLLEEINDISIRVVDHAPFQTPEGVCEKIREVVLKADEGIGGVRYSPSTMTNWVTDHFLPELERAGLMITPQVPEVVMMKARCDKCGVITNHTCMGHTVENGYTYRKLRCQQCEEIRLSFAPLIEQRLIGHLVDQRAGNDCPHCGKKGTVFRCPNRDKGGHWNDGTGVVCYICINCTMCDVHGAGCSPGLGKGKEYWEATPEISQDLFNRIKYLYDDSAKLLQIRLALGLDKMWKAVLDVDGCTAQGHTEPGTCSRCGMEI